MKITIKFFEHETFEIQIDKKSSILELKYKIEKEKNIHHLMQRLIYKGYTLQDKTVIENNNINDGSIIHLILVMNSIYKI